MNTKDTKNKISINLSSIIKDDKEHFFFVARINGAELKLHKEEDKEITKFTSYRKELVKFFIEKRIILFIIENYIYSQEDISDNEIDNYFNYTGARNAASNFYKMMEKVLNKYDYFYGVPIHDFDKLTIEMIYNNRDNSKFQELFDYIEFEHSYPEYYISFLLFINICIFKVGVFSTSGIII